MGRYVPFPRAVSPSLRDQVFDMFPVLAADTSRALAFRRILEYVLFAPYRFDTAALLAPRETIASLVGVQARSRGYRTIDWLMAFEDYLFPLNVTDACYKEGKARVIRPDVPPTILAAREGELPGDLREVRPRRVWFVTGKPVSQRRFDVVIRGYEANAAIAMDQDQVPGHPAEPLLHLLNEQPVDTLERVIKASWPGVMEEWRAMPRTFLAEVRRRDAAERVLQKLKDTRFMHYGTSGRTSRIFAQGASIHVLPRELRKTALQQGIALDLRACQLAVVAKLWRVQALQRFLETGRSIWAELLTYMGLPLDQKPLVKKGAYALTFGMGRKRLWDTLINGDDLLTGMEPQIANRFFQHHLVRELLSARREAYERVEADGGARDAFGRWIGTDTYKAHEVVVQQAQSYELRLMLAALPVLTCPDVAVLSWLHDGITIRVQNHTKEERRVRQIKQAVEAEAGRLGIATEMEEG